MNVKELTEILRGEIENGKLLSGDRLPSMRVLASKHGMSHMSVKKAIQNLERDGLTCLIHGKGVFVGDSPVKKRPRKIRMIGLTTIGNNYLGIVERLKEEWLAKGWLITHYDAGQDLQDPKVERDFLRTAEEQGFAGVALMPTPRQPVNNTIFRQMRYRGMKIALLFPNYAPTDESFFFLDFWHAGYLAASQAAFKGYENIVFFDLETPRFYTVSQLEGLEKACQDFNINQLATIHGGEMDPKTREEIIDHFKNLPENTVVAVHHSSCAENVRQLLLSAKRSIPEEIGLCDLFGSEDQESDICGIRFPEQERFEAAIQYIADDSTTAADKKQIWFKPDFIHRNSLRKSSDKDNK